MGKQGTTTPMEEQNVRRPKPKEDGLLAMEGRVEHVRLTGEENEGATTLMGRQSVQAPKAERR